MPALIARHAAPRVAELLNSFRIVLLGGARQVGKTTLARDILDVSPAGWLSLDSEDVLARALDDPIGFVEMLPRPAVIDEFQRAGRGFLLAIKQMADRDKARGQFLLTGSTNYTASRSISETLAGRVGRLQLWPLSVGERRGSTETFVDRLFDPSRWPPTAEPIQRPELVDLILEGGYPEIVSVPLTGRAREDWFEAYVDDVVSREALRPIAEVRLESELRRLLRLLAARTGQELVISDLAADAEVSRPTLANYVALLEALHLVVLLPAWATNATTRAKRHPKVLVTDSGLAADLCGAGVSAFGPSADGRLAGALYETFVCLEVLKQVTWTPRSVDISYYRDRGGAEVDLIVEDRRSGEVAAIEIKLTSTPQKRHAQHLERLRDHLDTRFTTGLVIHAGSRALSFGDRIWAVPVSALWGTG